MDIELRRVCTGLEEGAGRQHCNGGGRWWCLFFLLFPCVDLFFCIDNVGNTVHERWP